MRGNNNSGNNEAPAPLSEHATAAAWRIIGADADVRAQLDPPSLALARLWAEHVQRAIDDALAEDRATRRRWPSGTHLSPVAGTSLGPKRGTTTEGGKPGASDGLIEGRPPAEVPGNGGAL